MADIKRLIEELNDPSMLRGWIVKELAESDDPAAIRALVGALKEDDSFLESDIRNALRGKGVAAVPALIEGLHHPEVRVRRYSAATLGDIGDASARPALLEALEEEREPEVRAGILYALGGTGNSADIPKLLEARGEEDPDVRRLATFSLGKIGDSSVIPVLKNDLENGNWKVREGAARALGNIGDASVIPALVRALKDVEQVESVAVEALGKIGEPAIPALTDALGDADPGIRWRVVEALGKIGNSHAVPGLFKALEDSDKKVREHAVRTLRNMGEPAVPGLIGALVDKDSTVRRNAADALQHILENCNDAEKLNEFDRGVSEGYGRLAKMRVGDDLRIEIQMHIARMAKVIAIKKNELFPKRDLILNAMPKPPRPKKGMWHSVRKQVACR